METLNITNSQGREFAIRIVRKGDNYGRNRCMTHERDEPMVEFYDATYAGKSGFDAEGQFVGRYSAETLLNRDQMVGLDLHGGEPAWKIDVVSMMDVTFYVMDAVA